MMERWFSRKVRKHIDFPRGLILFQGQQFEPANTYGHVGPGVRVQVRRLTGPSTISVRKVYPDGSFGGEETWEDNWSCGQNI